MPPQDRVDGNDGSNVGQGSASQTVPMYGEPTSIIVGEPLAPPTQLASENSILFDQVGHALVLQAVQPPGQNRVQVILAFETADAAGK